jgi:shikimate kinase
MSPPDHRQSLLLVGYRGTGKSTVGRILAERLGRPFADADVELEAIAGRTIPAIFAELGEPAFATGKSASCATWPPARGRS